MNVPCVICPKCRRPSGPSARKCSNCRAPLITRQRRSPASGRDVVRRIVQHDPQPHTVLSMRWKAGLLDGPLPCLLLFGVTFALTGFRDPWTAGLAMWLGDVVYETNLIYHEGATLGMQAFKLRVGTLDATRLTFDQALGRALCKSLLGHFLVVGYLVALFRSDRRALHDVLAKTRVVPV